MPLARSLTVKDIYQMMVGYQESQIMHTACTLGVFETLNHTPVSVTSDAVASTIQTDPEATERLLNACAGMGLVEVNMDGNGIATYTNSNATEKFLVSSSAMSMKSLCLMQGDLYKLFGCLPAAIKDGNSQMQSALGTGKQLFERGSGFHNTEEKQYGFLQCMHMFSRMDSPYILDAFDLGEFDSVCDLGGGTGALAFEIANKYSDMRVSVMELPHVVVMAKRFMPKSQPKNLTFTSGDFFRDSLPTVDLYMISHVIHDWSQSKINQLLSKVYNALRPGGALLICEKILRDLKDGPKNTLLFDIGMLLATEGKERTADEYRTLLVQNRFTDIQTKRLPEMCFRDVIMARK